MQTLCEVSIDWDEQLSGKLLTQWNDLVKSLGEAPSFQVPRCYLDGIEERVVSYTLAMWLL